MALSCTCPRCRHHGGRPREPDSVPIHAGRSRRKRAESVDRQAGRQDEAAASACRFGHRPANGRPGGIAGGRSSTASRLGIAPDTIDNTLYDAFGQRQISTMYTQLNQYHVILEADPAIQASPARLQDLYIQTSASAGGSGPGAATSFAASGSSSAGSNATTTSVQYTPTSGCWHPRRMR